MQEYEDAVLDQKEDATQRLVRLVQRAIKDMYNAKLRKGWNKWIDLVKLQLYSPACIESYLCTEVQEPV